MTISSQILLRRVQTQVYLTTTISDHFVQFVLFKTEKTNKCNSKHTKYIRDFKNLIKENFESDIKETKWDEILELNKGNV